MKKLTLAVMVTFALVACDKKTTTSPAPSTSSAAAPAPAPAPAPAEAPAPAPATATSDASTTTASAGGGQAVFSQTCVACHGAGVGGAPKVGDKADWGPRIAQGNDTLYTHAIQGFSGKKGVMPPKGGNAALSDDQVKSAVDYMVSQAK